MASPDTLQDELAATRNEYKEFVYVVSHDFGAPLRAVVSFSKILADQYEHALDEKGVRYLRFITEGGEKMQAMLAGMVQYSRLNTQQSQPEPLEAAAVIGKCHAALREKIAACKGTISVSGELPEITMDAAQCLRLFLAVIDNALTYHAKGVTPQVRIAAQDAGNAWKFRVEDNGIGIAAADTARVFEVFKRLHTDDEYPGIGMGLALARKIVRLHGGEIGIDPGKNGGSVCWFTLAKPRAETAVVSSLLNAYG